MFLSVQRQIIIGFILIVLMILTRGNHFAAFNQLPSASWAVFLLAGFYLSSKWVFPALLILAGSLDYLAITFAGVSSYCVSPAYPLLIPAYGSLWIAGRWCQQRYALKLGSLFPLTIAVTVSTALCTVISSGGFYFFSGRYTDTTLFEFGQRFSLYFPDYLANVVLYVSIAMISHVLVLAFNNMDVKSKNTLP